VALRQCFIEGVGAWGRCDRPMGPLTVVMETLPFGLFSRTAAIALRHGLARLVPYSAPATQRTTAESGS